MGDQRSRHSGTLPAAEALGETPQGSESKHHADDSEAVLVACGADVVRHPIPRCVSPPQVRIVLDEQDGEGDQQKSRAHKEPLHSRRRVGLGEHDQNHHEVPQGLGPPLEGHEGVVGPQDACGAIVEEDEERSVCSKHRPDATSSGEKHYHAACQKPGQDEPVERTPIDVLVGRLHHGRELQPLGQRSRRADRHPCNGKPKGSRNGRLPISVQPEKDQDRQGVDDGSGPRGHLGSRKRRCRSSRVSTLWISVV